MAGIDFNWSLYRRLGSAKTAQKAAILRYGGPIRYGSLCEASTASHNQRNKYGTQHGNVLQPDYRRAAVPTEGSIAASSGHKFESYGLCRGRSTRSKDLIFMSDFRLLSDFICSISAWQSGTTNVPSLPPQTLSLPDLKAFLFRYMFRLSVFLVAKQMD